MHDLAPVVIFAYNRPDKLRRLIASLQACEQSGDTDFIFYIDGPRTEADAAAVAEVREIADQSGLASARVVASDRNSGLRQSVFQGVSEVVGRYGRAIVLEDDLILSPIALRYFNEALAFYEKDERVWSICGYIQDAPSLRNLDRTLLLPMTHSWGWATWQRAWDRFDLDARPSDESLRSPSFRRMLDVNGLFPLTRILQTSIAGLVSSWFAHWNYTVFVHGGYSVFPPRRVLDNIGIGAGTHGGRFNPHNALVQRPPLLDTVPRMTQPGALDYAAIDELIRCREARVQRFIVFAGYQKRRLKTLRLSRSRQVRASGTA